MVSTSLYMDFVWLYLVHIKSFIYLYVLSSLYFKYLVFYLFYVVAKVFIVFFSLEITITFVMSPLIFTFFFFILYHILMFDCRSSLLLVKTASSSANTHSVILSNLYSNSDFFALNLTFLVTSSMISMNRVRLKIVPCLKSLFSYEFFYFHRFHSW